MTTILGINAFHGDASAAIVVDGQLVAAVEEERYTRIKHWAGLPIDSIRYCLQTAGRSLGEIDHVALSFNPRANLAKKIVFAALHRPSLTAVFDRVRRQGKSLGLAEQLAQGLEVSSDTVRASFHRIEHHQSHVAASFLVSPFEEAAVLSIDGMGDFTSTLTAHAQGTSWQEGSRVFFPHSLGFLYSTITMFLGFPNYGDEYKVMGLAAFGEPQLAHTLRKLILPKGDGFTLNLDYFTHHRCGIKMQWQHGSPVIEPFHSSRLVDVLGPPRQIDEPLTPHHHNIASSLQCVTEEIILHLLNRLARKTKTSNLCMTGGVAMNSVANGKIAARTPFRNVFIPAGAADNGTAIGAAFYVWNRILGKPRVFTQNHAYWGCESDDRECVNAIKLAALPYSQHEPDDLIEKVSDLIVAGKVVGWFQGRMEFGARALGNRSLLADPRRPDMLDIINRRIKFRENFRPFAPSVLEERLSEWFDCDGTTPFMEKVVPVRRDKAELIPAVTHVDASTRPHSVCKRSNALFYALIARFCEKTGVPMVLNTSLNENEPIVRTPAQAVACFLRTDMDAICLGTHLVVREVNS